VHSGWRDQISGRKRNGEAVDLKAPPHSFLRTLSTVYDVAARIVLIQRVCEVGDCCGVARGDGIVNHGDDIAGGQRINAPNRNVKERSNCLPEKNLLFVNQRGATLEVQCVRKCRGRDAGINTGEDTSDGSGCRKNRLEREVCWLLPETWRAA